MTEFVEDEVGHAEVNKGVTAALVLDHTPSQGSNSQEEGSNWTRLLIVFWTGLVPDLWVIGGFLNV